MAAEAAAPVSHRAPNRYARASPAIATTAAGVNTRSPLPGEMRSPRCPSPQGAEKRSRAPGKPVRSGEPKVDHW